MTDFKIEITHQVELEPFLVPDYVVVKNDKTRPRQEGVDFKAEKINIRDLSASTLENLCKEFRRGVFAKHSAAVEEGRSND